MPYDQFPNFYLQNLHAVEKRAFIRTFALRPSSAVATTRNAHARAN